MKFYISAKKVELIKKKNSIFYSCVGYEKGITWNIVCHHHWIQFAENSKYITTLNFPYLSRFFLLLCFVAYSRDCKLPVVYLSISSLLAVFVSFSHLFYIEIFLFRLKLEFMGVSHSRHSLLEITSCIILFVTHTNFAFILLTTIVLFKA